MANAAQAVASHRSVIARWTTALAAAVRPVASPLLFGLRLWASVSLALHVSFWLELDSAFWAGTSAAIVCQPQLGASLRKGWFRLIGTLIGAVMSVVLIASFPQDRGLLLGSLALWGAMSALAATLLRNFAAYAAALAGYTVAIIVGDLLGATGGIDANAAFLLAVSRASEISIGIVCAGIVLALTDLGGARQRLAAVVADLASRIASSFTGMVASTGSVLPDTQPMRREFIRQVVALEPLVDQTLGESSQIRYHSGVLQRAVDGLLAALTGWRAVVNHLVRVPEADARLERSALEQSLPPDLRLLLAKAKPSRWLSDPSGMHRMYESAARDLNAFPAPTPALRLLADHTAKALAGLADALNGVALLRDIPLHEARSERGILRPHVPDWLPAFVNAGRAFITIGAVALFWILTGWPGGATAIVFVTIALLLLAPREDAAYSAAVFFLIGIVLDVIFAAIAGFALLPSLGTESFAALSLVIGLCLVPGGALLALARKPWAVGMLTAMTVNFIPLLSPTSPVRFDTVQFYNQALAILGGNVAAVIAFRLFPPLSPAFRTRRLLALSLRDLRCLAAEGRQSNWEGHLHARLWAMPGAATPLQRAQLLAALATGNEIMKLRTLVEGLGLQAALTSALVALARGESARAIACLTRLDDTLALRAAGSPQEQSMLRARGSILALSELLAQHASYFDAEANR